MPIHKTDKNRNMDWCFGVDIRWRRLPGEVLTDFILASEIRVTGA